MTASDGNTRLIQTVGDEMALHLAVELTLSDAVEIGEEGTLSVTASLCNGSVQAGADPETLPVTETDGSGMTIGVDPKTNRVSCLLLFESPVRALQGEKTLVFSDFQLGGEPLEEPVHYISWKVENKAQILEMDLKTPAGEKVGTAVLTPFALRVKVFPLSAAGIEEDGKKNSYPELLMKDGSSASVSGSYGGGWGTGSAEIHIACSEALDLSQIQAVVLGECRAELP